MDLGEDARKNGEEALTIFQSLDERGVLPPPLKAMLSNLKTQLDALPNP
jgi:hypothetical protein